MSFLSHYGGWPCQSRYLNRKEEDAKGRSNERSEVVQGVAGWPSFQES